MNMMVPTQNTRSPVSQIPGVGRKDALYLWSAFHFAKTQAAGLWPVFVTPVSQIGQGFAAALTARETSITANPGQVPLDQRWEAFDIGVHLDTGAPEADAANFITNTQIVFVRGQTQTTVLGPTALFPGGAGIGGYSEASNAGTGAAAQNGVPALASRRRLGRSIMLNPGDTWNMAFQISGSGVTALNLSATLDVWISLWVYRDLGLSG